MHAPLIDYPAPGKDALLCVPTAQRAFQCSELMSPAGVNSCPFLNTMLA
jgi:hypothetical protein